MTFQDLPCGSIWNTYAEELTDMAVRFAHSAPAIQQEQQQPQDAAQPQQPDGGNVQ